MRQTEVASCSTHIYIDVLCVLMVMSKLRLQLIFELKTKINCLDVQEIQGCICNPVSKTTEKPSVLNSAQKKASMKSLQMGNHIYNNECS